MTGLRKSLLVVVVLILAAGAFEAWKIRVPAPQSQFAEMQPAPDFTTSDQDGHPFTLSSLHGSRVVLVFYRGYW